VIWRQLTKQGGSLPTKISDKKPLWGTLPKFKNISGYACTRGSGTTTWTVKDVLQTEEGTL
jgi:hypothetical protein